MAISPPPPVVVRPRRGLGCFGIGCVVVLVVLLLAGTLLGGLVYLLSSEVKSLTSTTPAYTQTFDGGDDVSRNTNQKINDFEKALQQNQPATLELSADEINTLIARNPDFKNNQISLFVTLNGDTAGARVSLPTALVSLGWLKGRYANGSAEFTPTFDPATKNLHFALHALTFGSGALPAEQLPQLQGRFDTLVNMQFQRSPDAQSFLARVQSIEVRDSKLIIKAQ